MLNNLPSAGDARDIQLWWNVSSEILLVFPFSNTKKVSICVGTKSIGGILTCIEYFQDR